MARDIFTIIQRLTRCWSHCLPHGNHPPPLTLHDESLSDLTLEQTTILNRETGLQSSAILEIYCVSSAEYPNKTLTLNIFLKYVDGRENNARNFPGLVGK